jgi:hypothetical protein
MLTVMKAESWEHVKVVALEGKWDLRVPELQK